MNPRLLERTRILFSLLLPLGLLAASPAARAESTPRFLTGPAESDPQEVALAYLKTHRDELGLADSDLAEVVVKDRYLSKHNGVTHLYFQQRHQGLDVVNGILNVNVGPDGTILNIGNRFVLGLDKRLSSHRAVFDADGALAQAAKHIGLPTGEVSVRQKLDGPTRSQVFSPGALSQDPIPVRLVYFPKGDEVHLAWDLVIHLTNGRHWWNLWIDAESGELLGAHDWVGRFNGTEEPVYLVFAPPLMNPYEGKRSLQKGPLHPPASPYGWHDIDGRPGSEFGDTRGNNVFASLGGTGLKPADAREMRFDASLDLEREPQAYSDAAVTNLFYWVNYLHDLHYRYGFDEAAGNFQLNNYGNGGAGGDAVLASAQVAEMVAFAAPPDGLSPQMRMFVATPVTALLPMQHTVSLQSSGPASARSAERGAEIPAAGALFGEVLTRKGVSGKLAIADDGSTGEVDHPGGPGDLRRGSGSPADACESLLNSDEVRGSIALVEDGTCTPAVKARNAQLAGAVGVVIVQPGNDGEPPTSLGGHGTADDVTIPVVAVRGVAGGRLRAAATRGTSVLLASDNDRIHRDSDLDSGVLIHEYGHGIANRLTGGPSSAGCLQTHQGLGLVEGTADFWALALTAKPDHSRETPRGVSAYVFFQPQDGPGVRRVPYSSDRSLNRFTFEDLARFGENTPMIPHAAGVRWATALWEVYWNLVEAHGFDEDLLSGRGGNNMMLQLVMDGLKLQPCSPTFVEARDAILLADLIDHGGKNQCLIWEGFARRGLGAGAYAGKSSDDLEVRGSSEVPSECRRRAG